MRIINLNSLADFPIDLLLKFAKIIICTSVGTRKSLFSINGISNEESRLKYE